jgi:hypothetical protein
LPTFTPRSTELFHAGSDRRAKERAVTAMSHGSDVVKEDDLCA